MNVDGKREGVYPALLFFFLLFFFFISEQFNKEVTKDVEIIVVFFHLYKLKGHLLFPVEHDGFLGKVVTQWTSRAWAGYRQHIYCTINCQLSKRF